MDCRRPQFYSWVGKILWSRDRLPTPVFLGFPNDSDSKKTHLQCRRTEFDPWVEKISGVGYGNPLWYSCLENPHGQRSLVGYS